MLTHREESLQRDITRIRDHVWKMSLQAEKALNGCLKSYLENNRQLAYEVILRDQHIDRKEKEIDRLCLEFLVRQDPVAGLLRFAYSTIRINLEIERIGDYAECIARQVLKLYDDPNFELKDEITELSNLSITMFHDSIRAFMDQDTEIAQKSIETEKTVDVLRSELNSRVVSLLAQQKISPMAVDPLMTIIRKFERVSDQARNICMEVLYMCTGEYTKHPSAEAFRILFVDDHNSCRSQMAEAIASSLNLSRFIFASAGIEPKPVDCSTIDFMLTKGIDLSRVTPKTIHQIPNLDHYQVIVCLTEKANKAFPHYPRKMVFLHWPVIDPSKLQDSREEINKAYEKTYNFIKNHITDLVNAIIDTDSETGRE
jgi:phosphate transport system protein